MVKDHKVPKLALFWPALLENNATLKKKKKRKKLLKRKADLTFLSIYIILKKKKKKQSDKIRLVLGICTFRMHVQTLTYKKQVNTFCITSLTNFVFWENGSAVITNPV